GIAEGADRLRKAGSVRIGSRHLLPRSRAFLFCAGEGRLVSLALYRRIRVGLPGCSDIWHATFCAGMCTLRALRISSLLACTHPTRIPRLDCGFACLERLNFGVACLLVLLLIGGVWPRDVAAATGAITVEFSLETLEALLIISIVRLVHFLFE